MLGSAVESWKVSWCIAESKMRLNGLNENRLSEQTKNDIRYLKWLMMQTSDICGAMDEMSQDAVIIC